MPALSLNPSSASLTPSAQPGRLRCAPVLLLLLWSSPPAAASVWSGITEPSQGPARVIGETSGGCIAGAVALPSSGPGFVTSRLARHRFFGHPDLVRFVTDLGARTAEHTGKRLVIGDLSQPLGGPMPSGHRSHQSGIDADIWLWLAPASQVNLDDLDRDGPPSMVQDGADTVDNRRWSRDQAWLLKQAASHPDVDRIFVNPAIKGTLCAEAGQDRGWLRKLRPWWYHTAHMHVRLRCPQGSDDCVPQPPLPAGDGCDADLAWWFSDEAKQPRPPARTPGEKPLPKECTALLTRNSGR